MELRPGVLRCLGSVLYDSLLLLAVLAAAGFLFLILFGDATAAPRRHYFQVYLALCCMGYFVGFWMHGGQTLAMRTWRIRLVSEQGRLTLAQAALRCALAPLGLLLFFWAWFDRERCFLHDRLARTRLVLC